MAVIVHLYGIMIEFDHTLKVEDMTVDEFTKALKVLKWKQSEFCRKTGLNKSTPTNWVQGKNPIPLWVDAYLGAMLDLQALHDKYLRL